MDKSHHEVGLALLLLLSAAACREAAAPQLSYLAILPTIVAPRPSVAGSRFDYHVKELSGQIPIDTTVSVAPTDTVILPLPPATYQVELTGVPAQCHVREAGPRNVVIAEQTNTTALRYFVLCQSQLLLSVFTEGPDSGIQYVYHVADAGGATHLGLLRSNDTLEFEGLAAGLATIDLANVPPQCMTANNGGGRQLVPIDSGGGVDVSFHVRCADPIHQPHVLSLRASYHDGAAAIVLRASDPDRDLERYVWDLTDCRRTSLIGGASTRGGLAGGRTANQDSITILAAFDIGLPDSALHDKCAAVWLTDTQGNPSEVVEIPLRESGQRPSASLFNAHFLGVDLLRTELAADDADGDFLGAFVEVRLRDGTIGQPDGEPDVAYFNTVGYLGSVVPDVPLGNGHLTYDRFYAVILYLLDAQGNFTRLEDVDLFR